MSRETTLSFSNVAKTLELVVPLIEHPTEIFLSQLEEASVKLILNSSNKQGENVVVTTIIIYQLILLLFIE